MTMLRPGKAPVDIARAAILSFLETNGGRGLLADTYRLDIDREDIALALSALSSSGRIEIGAEEVRLV